MGKRNKGWYRTQLYADPKILELFGQPIISDNYLLAPESETEQLIDFIVNDLLDDEERELIWLRFYERMSYRKIAEQVGHTTHGKTQGQIKRILKKIRREYIDRATTGKF